MPTEDSELPLLIPCGAPGVQGGAAVNSALPAPAPAAAAATAAALYSVGVLPAPPSLVISEDEYFIYGAPSAIVVNSSAVLGAPSGGSTVTLVSLNYAPEAAAEQHPQLHPPAAVPEGAVYMPHRLLLSMTVAPRPSPSAFTQALGSAPAQTS